MPEETAILVSRNSREVRIPEGMRSAQRPRGEAGRGDVKQAGTQRTRVPGANEDGLSSAHVVIRPVPRIKPSRPPPALVEALKARQKSAVPSVSPVFKNRGLDLSERINRLRESNDDSFKTFILEKLISLVFNPVKRSIILFFTLICKDMFGKLFFKRNL